jgi:hypothetical protein
LGLARLVEFWWDGIGEWGRPGATQVVPFPPEAPDDTGELVRNFGGGEGETRKEQCSYLLAFARQLRCDLHGKLTDFYVLMAFDGWLRGMLEDMERLTSPDHPDVVTLQTLIGSLTFETLPDSDEPTPECRAKVWEAFKTLDPSLPDPDPPPEMRRESRCC